MSSIRTAVLVWTVILTGFWQPAARCHDEVFLIGNSLTWNTRPWAINESNFDLDWSIFCGQNLQFIYDHPQGYCVDSSFTWTFALGSNSYDNLVIQPFAGTTIDQDIDIISSWIEMQPGSLVVIHPGWNEFTDFPDDYVAPFTGDMKPSAAYINTLMAELRERFPERKFSSTRSHFLLYEVYRDTVTGEAPFESISHLYSDDIHMNSTGQYLMHNAMRVALGRPRTAQGFTGVPVLIRNYLDEKLNLLNLAPCDDLPGDMNRDGIANLLDVVPFVDALVAAEYNCAGDVNQDGQFNLLDVSAMVNLIMGN